MKNTTGLINIDTIQINSFEEPAENIRGFHSDYKKNGNTGKCQLIFNPNTHINVDQIFDYDTCVNSCYDALTMANLIDYTISRVDYAFDMYGLTDYKDYSKINRLLLKMFSIQYSGQLIDVTDKHGKRRSTKFINEYFDIEVYDKKEEEPDGNVTNRFEIRMKKLNSCDLEDAFHEAYRRALTKINEAITENNYSAVVNENNMDILTAITDHKNGTRRKAVDSVLYDFRDDIISTEQLLQLYEMLSYNNPVRKARDFINFNGIEKISFTQVKKYVAAIKKAFKIYFRNDLKNVSFEKNNYA